MSVPECWSRLASAEAGVLATIATDGSVDAVPFVFHAARPLLHFAVDDVKPKGTLELARLANLRRDPRVTVVADHYEPEWSRLWWVRAKGPAEVLDDGREITATLDALAAKYEPYRSRRPPGPVVRIRVISIAGWRAA